MTNNHAPSLFAEAADLLQVWLERSQHRSELAHWSERDIHDAGLSLGDVAFEAGKPFWRG